MREHVWTWKFIGEFSKSSCKTQCDHTMIHSDKFTSKTQRKVAMCGRKRPGVAIATKGFFLCDGIATLGTAWRCGGILCSFCRQLKPIKDIMFNGFYYCLIYNIKLELPVNSEPLLIAPTSSRHNAKPRVVLNLR